MTGIFPSKLYAGSYPAIKAELIDTVISEITEDPCSEKIVLVPSNYVAEDIYDGLTQEAKRSSFNFRAITILDFARILLKHRRILITEIDSMTRAVLCAEIVDSICLRRREDSYFHEVFRKKGFVSSLLRLFDEFEEGMIAKREVEHIMKNPHFLRSFPNSRKIKELLDIYVGYLMRAEQAGLKTRAAVVRLASEGFEVPGYPFRVKLYGFYDFTRLQWILIEKLMSSGLINEVFFPLPSKEPHGREMVLDDIGKVNEIIPEWYHYAQPALTQFLRHHDGNITILHDKELAEKSSLSVRNTLFGDDFDDSPRNLPFTLISSPHSPGELRAVSRLIKKDENEGRTGKKRGLIYRHLDEGKVLDIERVLTEFTLPYEIAWSTPLFGTSPVKTLMRMVKLPFRDYPRRETVDILTSPYLDLNAFVLGSVAHSTLWDHLTKKIGITKGGDWTKKLQYIVDKSSKMAKTREDEELRDEKETTSYGDGLRKREIDSALVLLRCFKKLKESLELIHTCDSFEGLSEFVRGLLKRYLYVRGKEDMFAFHLRVVTRATHLLEKFGELDWRGVPFTTPRRAIELLEKIFQEEKTSIHTPGFARGKARVIAGDITSLRGIIFDEIYMLSTNEGAWPRTKGAISLLNEEERALFIGELFESGLPSPLGKIRENIPEEKLLFCLPFIMGKSIRALSFLRSDISGAKKIPSPLLTDLISRYRGPDTFLNGLTAEVLGEGLLEFPRQLKDRFKTPGDPSAREMLISYLMKIPPGGGKPPLSGGTRKIMERTIKTLSEWMRGEELAPDPEGIKKLRIPRGKLNHTFLENYTTCPYRTYLRYGLNLEPLPEPEEIFSLGRLEMGIIIHRALLSIYADEESSTSSPIENSVRRAIDEYGRNNPLGLQGLLKITAKNLTKILTDYLSWEKIHLRDFSHEMFELTFGFGDGYDIFLDIEGEKFPISGKIDRIDRKGDMIQVLDYKLSFGNKFTPLEDKISFGILNQIPLYAIAAKKICEDKGIRVSSLTGGYIALKRDKKRGYLITAPVDQEGDMVAAWKKSLSYLLKSLKTLSFPPMADTDFKMARWKRRYCEYCEYKDICRVAPMTRGNEIISQSLKEKIPSIYQGLTWHIRFREASQ